MENLEQIRNQSAQRTSDKYFSEVEALLESFGLTTTEFVGWEGIAITFSEGDEDTVEAITEQLPFLENYNQVVCTDYDEEDNEYTRYDNLYRIIDAEFIAYQRSKKITNLLAD
ncbi:hypothetical protein [Pontibacter sp. H249]|uniref:hypothetical protein n=1 Tax=Pontibacter sp. H249 TaxID=3133420 RepID=UPI0030C13D1A